MKSLIPFLMVIAALSCKDRASKKSDSVNLNPENDLKNERMDMKSSVDLNGPNDTNNVTIQLSQQKVNVSYYENRPQYINVDNNCFGKISNLNHFASANKGAYLSLDSASHNLKAFGVKYVDGHNGIDILIDSTGGPKIIKVWKEYKDDGIQLNLNKLEQGNISVYIYKNGDIADTFVLKKR